MLLSCASVHLEHIRADICTYVYIYICIPMFVYTHIHISTFMCIQCCECVYNMCAYMYILSVNLDFNLMPPSLRAPQLVPLPWRPQAWAPGLSALPAQQVQRCGKLCPFGILQISLCTKTYTQTYAGTCRCTYTYASTSRYTYTYRLYRV